MPSYFNDHNHTQRADDIAPISELGKQSLRKVRSLPQIPQHKPGYKLPEVTVKHRGEQSPTLFLPVFSFPTPCTVSPSQEDKNGQGLESKRLWLASRSHDLLGTVTLAPLFNFVTFRISAAN